MPKKYITLSEETSYKDLEPIFEEIYTRFLDETKQLRGKEDKTVRKMLLALNLRDLKENRKPQGYNRGEGTRLVFPIVDGPIEFYVEGSRKFEVGRVADSICGVLMFNGIEYRTGWDMPDRWDIRKI